MIALVDLHGAAVRVREDDPTSASSMLVLAKDPRLGLLQSRERRLERVDPETDESAAAHAPARAATRATGGKNRHTDTVELAAGVDETVTAVLVRRARRPVLRLGRDLAVGAGPATCVPQAAVNVPLATGVQAPTRQR